MQLGIAELLLEHELVEILSCIGLPLQGLQSLEDRTQNKSNHSWSYAHHCNCQKRSQKGDKPRGMKAEPSSVSDSSWLSGSSSRYSHLKQDRQLITCSVLAQQDKETSVYELLLPKMSPGNIYEDLDKLQINETLVSIRKKVGHGDRCTQKKEWGRKVTRSRPTRVTE